MHFITAILISLSTVLVSSTGVHAGGCPGASTTPSNNGFATFWGVEPTWAISEFGDRLHAKDDVKVSTIFECTNQCWDRDDCEGASYAETGDSKECYHYLTGVPGPMEPKNANRGLTAVAWKLDDACGNPAVGRHEAAHNPQDPHECCSIWMP